MFAPVPPARVGVGVGVGQVDHGRALMRLVPIEAGTVRLKGADITALGDRDLRPLRRDMQMVFQNPYSSLDPSRIVADSVGEPLYVHSELSPEERRARVRQLLHQVGLADHHLERLPVRVLRRPAPAHRHRPGHLREPEPPRVRRGGQCPRRVDPAPDHRAHGAAPGGAGHRLRVHRPRPGRRAPHLAPGGGDVPRPPRRRGAPRPHLPTPGPPRHRVAPVGLALPDPVRQRERKRIVLADELPDPTNLPSGCPFHTRCAYVMDVGREQMPAMTPVDGGGGGEVACHLQTTGPTLAGASIRELPVL